MAGEEKEYISLVQAVKLISESFDGNPKCLHEFCGGVAAARQVVHPTEQPLLLKFIEFKITGAAKDRLLVRTERNTWEEVKAILRKITQSEGHLNIMKVYYSQANKATMKQ
jgi:hypothetical protein